MRTVPNSARQPRNERRPSILNGLDDSIVITTEQADEYHRRPTTRQAVHGRQSALYDARYHPLDEITTPARAKAHRRRLGLPEESKDQEAEHATEQTVEEEPEMFYSTDKESEDDVRPTKRQQTRQSPLNPGSRHSARLSVQTQKLPLYNMKVHPQDAILKQLRVTRHESAPRKRKRKAEKPHVDQGGEENKVNRMHEEDQEEEAEGGYDSGSEEFIERELNDGRESWTEEDTRSETEWSVNLGNESMEAMYTKVESRSALLEGILGPIPSTFRDTTLGAVPSSPPSVPWLAHLERDGHEEPSGAFDPSQYLEDQNTEEDGSDVADQTNEISSTGLTAESQTSSQRITLTSFPRFLSPEVYEGSGLNLDLDQYFPVQE
jgi:hypothetical protein